MKKYIVVVVILLMYCTVFASAAGMSAQITGPGTVRSGDTIKLSLKLNGTNLVVVQGELSYNSSQLEYIGNGDVLSGWKMDMSKNGADKLVFMSEDDKQSAPLTGTKQLCTVSFKVKNIAVGTNIKVSVNNLAATDSISDFTASTASYSISVSASLSDNNALNTLSVNNAAITPVFNKSTLQYSLSVPFEVSKLEVSATAEDSKANVNISNPTLTPNATTKVTVTVTAENGAKKIYTINVKRAQDPNYQQNNDAGLSSITLDKSMLSPSFQSDITKYVVWLPYEVEKLDVKGIASASKSSVEVVGGENLEPGKDNIILVRCKSENGNTKEYTVIARRANIEGAAITSQPNVSSTTESQTSITNQIQQTNNDKSSGIPLYIVIIISVICISLGGGLTYLYFIKKSKIQAKKFNYIDN